MSNRIRRKKEKGKRFTAPPADNQSTAQKKPKFSLEYLQNNYCICQCEVKDRAAFANKLRELSQLTWAQITSSGKHQMGFEKIRRETIKAPIPKHITDDVTLIAVRFSGKKPMIGYRSREVFYIVWCDRNFSVYDH